MHQDFLPPGIVVLTGAGISRERHRHLPWQGWPVDA
jgi:hypothetical protein